MEMSVVDREWIKFSVDGAPDDLAAITSARMAFLLHDGSPEETDWHTAQFTDGDIRILVGPGAHELEPATYRPWCEITAPPELIRRACPGLVRITP
jgi:hypothetical protein